METTQHASIFAALTDSELAALFIRIRSGRDRAWTATGPDDNARYQVVTDASDIMADLHEINAYR